MTSAKTQDKMAEAASCHVNGQVHPIWNVL